MKIPNGFKLGAATSAFQIEGALSQDGRGPSIWDNFAGRTGHTGEIACDHYNRFSEDVKLMADLGLDAYRFSVAWPRIFPDGRGSVNQKGLDFYSRLVDELLENNIKPYPTLFHWDLPLALEKEGGWETRATSDHFADYADTVGQTLGDRVKDWFTLNEPWSVTVLGYQLGQHAPGKDKCIQTALKVVHHLLLAHGKALSRLRRQDKEYRVGIVLNPWVPIPLTYRAEDVEAARQAWTEQVAWWFDPIFCGKYPENRSPDDADYHKEGDMECISQPIDHLGLNYYFPGFIRASQAEDRDYEDCEPLVSLPRSEMGWPSYPAGLSFMLEEVHRRYRPQAIYLTESGCAAPDLVSERDEIEDLFRQEYLRSHLRETLSSREKGIPVEGYFAWSLMDNFEWDRGYTKRFGLYYVDYETLERKMKRSAHWYSRVCSQREIVGEPTLEG